VACHRLEPMHASHTETLGTRAAAGAWSNSTGRRGVQEEEAHFKRKEHKHQKTGRRVQRGSMTEATDTLFGETTLDVSAPRPCIGCCKASSGSFWEVGVGN